MNIYEIKKEKKSFLLFFFVMLGWFVFGLKVIKIFFFFVDGFFLFGFGMFNDGGEN